MRANLSISVYIYADIISMLFTRYFCDCVRSVWLLGDFFLLDDHRAVRIFVPNQGPYFNVKQVLQEVVFDDYVYAKGVNFEPFLFLSCFFSEPRLCFFKLNDFLLLFYIFLKQLLKLDNLGKFPSLQTCITLGNC